MSQSDCGFVTLPVANEWTSPPVHSILDDDECAYPWQALQQALDLHRELDSVECIDTDLASVGSCDRSPSPVRWTPCFHDGTLVHPDLLAPWASELSCGGISLSASGSGVSPTQDAAFPESTSSSGLDLDFTSFMQTNRSRSRSRGSGEDDHTDEDDEDDPPEPSDPPSDLERSYDASLLDWTLVTLGSPAPETQLHAGNFGPSIALAAQVLHVDVDELLAVHVCPFLRAALDEHVAIAQRHRDLVLADQQVLLIVDILCHHTQPVADVARPPHEARVVKKVARRHSFRTLMQELGLLQFARDYVEWGSLELNGFDWSPFNTHFRDLDHADHVLIQFAPHTGRDHRNDLNNWLLNEGVQLWSSNTSVGDNPVMASLGDEVPSSSHHAVCHASDSLLSIAQPVVPNMMFLTWYISHMFHPVCRVPRSIMLTQNSDSWKNTIVQTWDDLFDRAAPFGIAWVFPKPPGLGITPDDMYPHLIISQHPIHRQISAVITASVLGLQDVQVEQAAHSIPEISDAQTFQDAAETTRLCRSDFRCEVTFDGRALPHHPPARRPDRIAVNVIVSEQFPSQDGLHLMQRAVRLRPITQPDAGTGAPDDHPSADASGHAFVETHRISGRQRAFTRLCATFQDQLQPIWDDAAAVEREDEGPVLYVASYFISFPHMLDCAISRPVRLVGLPHTWFQQLRAAWIDTADLLEWTDVFVVQPGPLQTPATQGVAAHVILAQHLEPAQRAILVTTVLPSQISYCARIVDDTISRRQIIARSGMIFMCFSAASPHVCTVTFGWQLVGNAPFPIASGSGIQLLISTPTQQAASLTTSAEAAPVSGTSSELASGRLETRDEPSSHVTGHEPAASSSTGASASSHGQLGSSCVLSLDVLLPSIACAPSASVSAGFKPLRVPGLTSLSDRFRQVSTSLRVDLPFPELFPVEFASQLRFVLENPPADVTSPVYVWIFTDGSALFNIHDGDKRAAWSFVVVSQFADSSITFDGFQSAAVAPPGHPDSLPLLTKSDSHSAESEAIYRALCWCASSDTLVSGIPVCVVSDALAAMHGADGTWSSQSRPFLERVVRPLYGALQSIGPLGSTWERAHSGVLFNELADHLAKCAARDPVMVTAPSHLNADDLVPLQWLWLAWSSQLHEFGVDYGDDVIQLPVPPPTQLADVDCWPKTVSGPVGRLRFQCHVNLQCQHSDSTCACRTLWCPFFASKAVAVHSGGRPSLSLLTGNTHQEGRVLDTGLLVRLCWSCC
eukprot:Skav200964  [mRNA]  locus=scaffold448:503249:506983:- [translate_table: standard]